MTATAQGVVENLLFLCNKHGFVPNGSRSYYLNRSQPPLLSEMVCSLVSALAEPKDGDGEFERQLNAFAAAAFCRRALPVLEKEREFWASRRRAFRKDCAPLSSYRAETTRPRPESYREDIAVAARAKAASMSISISISGGGGISGTSGGGGGSSSEGGGVASGIGRARGEEDVYRELATAAESGWDFSSRWFRDAHSMEEVAASQVVPADLNAFLLRFELNLVSLYRRVGNAEGEERAAAAARARHEAMERFLWSGGRKEKGGGEGGGGMGGKDEEEEEGRRTADVNARWFDLRAWDDDDDTSADRGEGRGENEGEGAAAVAAKAARAGVRKREISASDFLPLWAYSHPLARTVLQGSSSKKSKAAPPPAATSWARAWLVASSLQASGLCGNGGVSATTATGTGQQWDAPNAWPPVLLLIVESLLDFQGLGKYGGKEEEEEKKAKRQIRALGASLAGAWLKSAMDGWKETGFMHEKYDYRGGGVAGHGGEYKPQVGFGWSNGAALALINRGLFPSTSR